MKGRNNEGWGSNLGQRKVDWLVHGEVVVGVVVV